MTMRSVLGPRWTIAAVLLVGCSSVAPTDSPDGDEAEVTSVSEAALSGPVTRSKVIANAEQWVAAKLKYCQSPNGKPDPDSACSSTCTRTSNPAWDPYRSDCSGLVSWAWELPAPGLSTAGFAPFGTSASKAIQCADLKPGDAANRSPSRGHIILFKKWVTPGSVAVFIEEPGCSSSTPYAHEFQSAVTCSGTSVHVAYDGDTFMAIRYLKIVDDPDAGSGSSSGPTSGPDGGGSDAGTAPSGEDDGAVGGSAPDGGTIEVPSEDGGSPGLASDLPAGDGAGCDVARDRSRGGWGPGAAIVLGLAGLRRARRRR